MSNNQNLLGGSTYRTVTDAQLNARRALLNSDELIDIYSDYNTVMIAYLYAIHGTEFRTLAITNKYEQLDYTKIYIDTNKYTSRILSDDQLYINLREHIATNSLSQTISKMYLLQHVRNQIPNSASIPDVKLINDPQYEQYRSTYVDTFNLDTITNIPTIGEFITSPFDGPYTKEYTALRNWLVNECTKNISYRIMSQLPFGFTRTDLAKTIHDFVVNCRNNDNIYADYAILQTHAPIDIKELFLIREVNKYIIQTLITEEIDFSNKESITSCFRDIIPSSTFYTKAYIQDIINISRGPSFNQTINIINNHFSAYLDYIECDVYMYDIQDSKDPSLIDMKDKYTVTSKIDLQIKQSTNYSGQIATDGEMTEIYSIKVQPRSLLGYFIELFYLFDNKYVGSSVTLGSVRELNAMSARKLTTMLFVLTNISHYINPVRVLDYIGICIGNINPIVNKEALRAMTKVATDPVRTARPPARGVNYISSDPTYTTLEPFSGGVREDIAVKCIVIIGIILLIVTLILLFRTKTKHKREKFVENPIEISDEDMSEKEEAPAVEEKKVEEAKLKDTSIKPVHPKTYSVHDYLIGKVPCDADHIRRGVNKEERKAITLTPNNRTMIGDTPVIDPEAVVNANATTEMFSIHYH